MRIPDHDFLRALLEQTGVLVVTSANPHGAPTPRTAQDVAASLGADRRVWWSTAGQLEDVPSTLVNVRAGRAGRRARGCHLRGPPIAGALAGAP